MLFPPELHTASSKRKQRRIENRTVDNLRFKAKEITLPLAVSMKEMLKINFIPAYAIYVFSILPGFSFFN